MCKTVFTLATLLERAGAMVEGESAEVIKESHESGGSNTPLWRIGSESSPPQNLVAAVLLQSSGTRKVAQVWRDRRVF